MCKLGGLTLPEHRELKKILSYRAYQRFYTLLGKHGDFPTGLLYLVEEFLARKSHSRQDDRKVPDYALSLKPEWGHEPYEEQLSAAMATSIYHRGIISAPTGSGKSEMIARVIDTLRVRTLIVVPSVELRRQLTESLAAIFGEKTVGRRGHPIAVENVDALDPADTQIGYDCVIIDEFHHAGAASYRKLNKKAWKDIYYRIGFTATPFRSDEDERLLLESVLSRVIYRLDYQTAVDKGYIVPLEAYYYDLPVEAPKKNGSWTQVGSSKPELSWPETYDKLIVNNPLRNNLIVDVMLRLSGRSILCLVREIAHGYTLSRLSETPFVQGKDEDRSIINKFALGAHLALVGTAGVLGEGVDTKACEYVILALGGYSKNAFMQQCGRGVRRFPGKESAKVIMFRDSSSKYLLKHFNAQVRYLRDEYGIKPVKLEWPL